MFRGTNPCHRASARGFLLRDTPLHLGHEGPLIRPASHYMPTDKRVRRSWHSSGTENRTHRIIAPCDEGYFSLGSRLFFFLQCSIWNYSAIEDDGMSLNSRKKDMRVNESVSLQDDATGSPHSVLLGVTQGSPSSSSASGHLLLPP